MNEIKQIQKHLNIFVKLYIVDRYGVDTIDIPLHTKMSHKYPTQCNITLLKLQTHRWMSVLYIFRDI